MPLASVEFSAWPLFLLKSIKSDRIKIGVNFFSHHALRVNNYNHSLMKFNYENYRILL